MQSDWITIDEAAARLGLDRSGVFRMAKRGEFGQIQPIGAGTKRPQIILVSAAAVAAVVAKRAS
jgi:excisionase family DNA binding protein